MCKLFNAQCKMTRVTYTSQLASYTSLFYAALACTRSPTRHTIHALSAQMQTFPLSLRLLGRQSHALCGRRQVVAPVRFEVAVVQDERVLVLFTLAAAALLLLGLPASLALTAISSVCMAAWQLKLGRP